MRCPEVLALLLATCLPLVAADWNGTGHGPYPVVRSYQVWTDPDRERAIPVVHYRPVGVAEPPLVVFSHGLGANAFIYAFLGEHLASHGYLSVHPTHRGSDSAVAEESPVALAAAAVDPAQRRARIADLAFVIELLRTHGGRDGLPAIDAERVAVAGHSLGTHAALALIGQRSSPPLGDGLDLPVVSCAVALSPLHPGPPDLDEESWRELAAPALFLTGTADVALGTADWRQRRIPFERSPAGGKVLAVIADADHDAFGDYDLVAGRRVRRDQRHHPWIEDLITAFLAEHLRDDAAAAAWLRAGGPASEGEIELEFRD